MKVNPHKILIADADEVYRSHLRDFLTEKEDFAIYDVGSGAAAVNSAVKNPPNVVLLDIALPDISGIEVCRKFKTDDQLKFIPVIIHTAQIGFKDRLSAFLAGAHKYLSKPCNLNDIYDCLQGVLRPSDNQSTSIAAVIDRIRR